MSKGIFLRIDKPTWEMYRELRDIYAFNYTVFAKNMLINKYNEIKSGKPVVYPPLTVKGKRA